MKLAGAFVLDGTTLVLMPRLPLRSGYPWRPATRAFAASEAGGCAGHDLSHAATPSPDQARTRVRGPSDGTRHRGVGSDFARPVDSASTATSARCRRTLQ